MILGDSGSLFCVQKASRQHSRHKLGKKTEKVSSDFSEKLHFGQFWGPNLPKTLHTEAFWVPKRAPCCMGVPAQIRKRTPHCMRTLFCSANSDYCPKMAPPKCSKPFRINRFGCFSESGLLSGHKEHCSRSYPKWTLKSSHGTCQKRQNSRVLVLIRFFVIHLVAALRFQKR